MTGRSHRWVTWVKGSRLDAAELKRTAVSRGKTVLKTCAKMFAPHNMSSLVEGLACASSTTTVDAESIASNAELLAAATEDPQIALQVRKDSVF